MKVYEEFAQPSSERGFLKKIFAPHSRNLLSVHGEIWAFSPSAKTLVFSDQGKLSFEFQEQVFSHVCQAPSGKVWVLSGNVLSVWSATEKRFLRNINLQNSIKNINSMAMVHDTIWVGHGGGICRVDTASERVLYSPATTNSSSSSSSSLRRAGGVKLLAFHENQEVVWAAHEQPSARTGSAGDSAVTVSVWNSRSGSLIADFGSSGAVVSSMAAVPAGRCWTGNRSGEVEVWDASLGTHITRQAHGRGAVHAVEPVGLAFVVTGGEDRCLCVWVEASAEMVKRVDMHMGVIRSALECPGGILWVASESALRLLNFGKFLMPVVLEAAEAAARSTMNATAPAGRATTVEFDDQARGGDADGPRRTISQPFQPVPGDDGVPHLSLTQSTTLAPAPAQRDEGPHEVVLELSMPLPRPSRSSPTSSPSTARTFEYRPEAGAEKFSILHQSAEDRSDAASESAVAKAADHAAYHPPAAEPAGLRAPSAQSSLGRTQSSSRSTDQSGHAQATGGLLESHRPDAPPNTPVSTTFGRPAINAAAVNRDLRIMIAERGVNEYGAPPRAPQTNPHSSPTPTPAVPPSSPAVGAPGLGPPLNHARVVSVLEPVPVTRVRSQEANMAIKRDRSLSGEGGASSIGSPIMAPPNTPLSNFKPRVAASRTVFAPDELAARLTAEQAGAGGSGSEGSTPAGSRRSSLNVKRRGGLRAGGTGLLRDSFGGGARPKEAAELNDDAMSVVSMQPDAPLPPQGHYGVDSSVLGMALAQAALEGGLSPSQHSQPAPLLEDGEMSSFSLSDEIRSLAASGNLRDSPNGVLQYVAQLVLDHDRLLSRLNALAKERERAAEEAEEARQALAEALDGDQRESEKVTSLSRQLELEQHRAAAAEEALAQRDVQLREREASLSQARRDRERAEDALEEEHRAHVEARAGLARMEKGLSPVKKRPWGVPATEPTTPAKIKRFVRDNDEIRKELALTQARCNTDRTNFLAQLREAKERHAAALEAANRDAAKAAARANADWSRERKTLHEAVHSLEKRLADSRSQTARALADGEAARREAAYFKRKHEDEAMSHSAILDYNREIEARLDRASEALQALQKQQQKQEKQQQQQQQQQQQLQSEAAHVHGNLKSSPSRAEASASSSSAANTALSSGPQGLVRRTLELQALVDALRTELHRRDHKIAALEAEAGERDSADELEARLRVERRVGDLTADRDRLIRDVERVTDELKRTKEEVKSLEATIVTVTSERDRLAVKFEDSRVQLSRMEHQGSLLKRELNQIKNSLFSKISETGDLPNASFG